MRRELQGLTLSGFEKLYHRHQKTTLLSEVKQCFEYFENHVPGEFGRVELSLIHGSKVEIKRTEEGKGFSVSIDGNVKTLGVDSISKEEQLEMVRRIRHITFPYNDYIKSMH